MKGGFLPYWLTIVRYEIPIATFFGMPSAIFVSLMKDVLLICLHEYMNQPMQHDFTAWQGCGCLFIDILCLGRASASSMPKRSRGTGGSRDVTQRRFIHTAFPSALGLTYVPR